MDSLGIGQLAKRGGVGIDTVRYYERNGLLEPLETRIADLVRVRDGLTTLIDACPGHGRAADCPILRALSEEAK
jgi:MerR family transcriptional regulator, copper efflux regulator